MRVGWNRRIAVSSTCLGVMKTLMSESLTVTGLGGKSYSPTSPLTIKKLPIRVHPAPSIIATKVGQSTAYHCIYTASLLLILTSRSYEDD